MKDRVGQIWNFPMRCEDGIHLVTGVIVEAVEPFMTDDCGDYHMFLILDCSSEAENRRSGSLLTVREPDWSQWDTLSSWTKLG